MAFENAQRRLLVEGDVICLKLNAAARLYAH